MGRIAITGANGFLGSHLVREALDQNYEVIALVRPNAALDLLPDNSNLSIQKINYDGESLGEMVKSLGVVDLFIHNAGITSTLRKNQYYQVNTTLTERLLKAIISNDVLKNQGKFIYVSSLAAKGPTGAGQAVSNYGESKIQAERSVISSGLSYMIFRPAGIYGPGDKAFLPIFKAAQKGLYLNISHVNQKITLIHGADAANNILQLASNLTDKIIPLTDGEVYGHKDLADALQLGRPKPLRLISIPPAIVRVVISVVQGIHKILGKNPALTREKYNEISSDWDVIHDDVEKTDLYIRFSLAEGFSKTFDYYRSEGLL